MADIWGDTVNLHHLGCAMVIGLFLGSLFYVGGLKIIEGLFPDLVASLQRAMGLIVGIVGCLLAAFISARLFPPKRTLTEESFSPESRLKILKEMGVNMKEEAELMKNMPADIIHEMKELQLYDVFAHGAETAPAPAEDAPKTDK